MTFVSPAGTLVTNQMFSLDLPDHVLFLIIIRLLEPRTVLDSLRYGFLSISGLIEVCVFVTDWTFLVIILANYGSIPRLVTLASMRLVT